MIEETLISPPPVNSRVTSAIREGERLLRRSCLRMPIKKQQAPEPGKGWCGSLYPVPVSEKTRSLSLYVTIVTITSKVLPARQRGASERAEEQAHAKERAGKTTVKGSGRTIDEVTVDEVLQSRPRAIFVGVDVEEDAESVVESGEKPWWGCGSRAETCPRAAASKADSLQDTRSGERETPAGNGVLHSLAAPRTIRQPSDANLALVVERLWGDRRIEQR